MKNGLTLAVYINCSANRPLHILDILDCVYFLLQGATLTLPEFLVYYFKTNTLLYFAIKWKRNAEEKPERVKLVTTKTVRSRLSTIYSSDNAHFENIRERRAKKLTLSPCGRFHIWRMLICEEIEKKRICSLLKTLEKLILSARLYHWIFSQFASIKLKKSVKLFDRELFALVCTRHLILFCFVKSKKLRRGKNSMYL